MVGNAEMSCLCFDCRMQNLYIRTASNPLPRPLLAHYPTKSEKDFDKHIGYGFVQGVIHMSTLLGEQCVSRGCNEVTDVFHDHISYGFFPSEHHTLNGQYVSTA